MASIFGGSSTSSAPTLLKDTESLKDIDSLARGSQPKEFPRRNREKEAFKKLASDVASTLAIENALSGKGPVKIPRSRGRGLKDSADFCPQPRTAIQITRGVLKECNAERKRSRSDSKEDTSDEALSKMARFTDKFNLKPFEPFLHYVPRL
eukprot:7381198-Prymnesium_polylepis.2